jgi:hypothetical protein
LAGDFLWFAEVLKIFMIHSHDHGVFSAEEEGLCTFETEDHGCKFFVMDIVVLFGGEETSGVEGYWVETIFMFLLDNYTQCVARRVGLHDKLSVPVWGSEHWFCSACLFKIIEGIVAFW